MERTAQLSLLALTATQRLAGRPDAAVFCGWGWVTRAGLGRLLLIAYGLALLLLAGYGIWHGGFPQPSQWP